MRDTMKAIGNKAGYGVQIVAVGALTGAFAGVVVTLYNVLVVMCEEFSVEYYNVFRTHPAFIPLLFVALFLGGIVIGGVLKFLPMIRGSGFPQTEGATKGLFRFKWYQVLTGMFAASLFTVFMGLSAGSEGPSLMIGGACGSGASDLLRRNAVVRRYQITGGACAGLAVALNAPLTGMVFAYEEAHKRFTPEVFVCSFSSVAVAIVIRNLLRPAMGLSVGPFLTTFSFPAAGDAGAMFCLYALLASFLVALCGVGFYFLLFTLRKLFKKLTFFKGMGKYTIPFVLAGAFGLVTAGVMGGGTELIASLGSGAEEPFTEVFSVFGAGFILSLSLILVMKFIVTVVNTASDLPCCCSIPMMAMGAALGALFSKLFAYMGMDPALSDTLIVLCMVTFFATVVKAPITGLIMVVELTWDFTFLLPAVLCVAMGYLVGNVFHTEPLYERLLDEILEERENKAKRVTVRLRVGESAAGREIRDILWPFTALVTGLLRAGETIVPKGATELCEGDVLTIEGKPEDREEYLGALRAVAGEVLEVLESEAIRETPEAPPEAPPEDAPEDAAPPASES